MPDNAPPVNFQSIVNALVNLTQVISRMQQSINALLAGTEVSVPIFVAGVPASGAIVRIAFTFGVAFPAGLAGSVGIAGTASTGTATVHINRISGGVSTPVGTAVFTASTNATFTATAAVTFGAGDMVEFAFPSPSNATLADVAISLAGTRV